MQLHLKLHSNISCISDVESAPEQEKQHPLFLYTIPSLLSYAFTILNCATTSRRTGAKQDCSKAAASHAVTVHALTFLFKLDKSFGLLLEHSLRTPEQGRIHSCCRVFCTLSIQHDRSWQNTTGNVAVHCAK